MSVDVRTCIALLKRGIVPGDRVVYVGPARHIRIAHCGIYVAHGWTRRRLRKGDVMTIEEVKWPHSREPAVRLKNSGVWFAGSLFTLFTPL